MKVVIDASVAVKWMLRSASEQDLDPALAILESIDSGRVTAIQPVHWLVEVLGVVARLRPALADDALEVLVDLNLPTVGDPAVLSLAVEQAKTLNHHLFDTLYHAVALAEGAVLITADETHFRKSEHLGRISRLADWPATQPAAPKELP